MKELREMREDTMEVTVFGMSQGHIHRAKTGLSKARRLATVSAGSLYNPIFEAESRLHVGTNLKKDLHWQEARRKSLTGTMLCKH